MEVKLIPPPSLPHDVQITLSQDEAASLRAVLNRVGGPPAGRRGHIDQLNNKLANLGISLPLDAIERGFRDSIYFK